MAIITLVLVGLAITALMRVLDNYSESTFAAFISDTIEAQIESMTAHQEAGGLLMLQNEIRNLAARNNNLYYILTDEEGGFVAGNFRKIPSRMTLIEEGLLRFEIEPENQLWIQWNSQNDSVRKAVSVAAKTMPMLEGGCVEIMPLMEFEQG